MAASGGSLKELVMAGLGVYTLTRERIESIVSGMVERGGIKQSDAGAVIDKLAGRADNERRVLTDIVREQMDFTMRNLGVVTRDDLMALAQRIERIENLLDT
jgi:polyhydroxyalkanoate synthesis regulator phasin